MRCVRKYLDEYAFSHIARPASALNVAIDLENEGKAAFGLLVRLPPRYIAAYTDLPTPLPHPARFGALNCGPDSLTAPSTPTWTTDDFDWGSDIDKRHEGLEWASRPQAANAQPSRL